MYPVSNLKEMMMDCLNFYKDDKLEVINEIDKTLEEMKAVNANAEELMNVFLNHKIIFIDMLRE